MDTLCVLWSISEEIKPDVVKLLRVKKLDLLPCHLSEVLMEGERMLLLSALGV